jgi:hypothetical protein
VYGFGLIGALVWYWRQAEEPSEYVGAVLKAVVWPAFLVYKAFAVLEFLATGHEKTSDPGDQTGLWLKSSAGSVRRGSSTSAR